MEYKKKYKEALERAREWYNNPNSSSIGKAYLYAVFPELKENEDERMRNIAIYACKYMVDNFENSTKQYEDAIAWLEKQGKQKPYGQRQECVDCQFNYAGECKGYCTMKKELSKIEKQSEQNQSAILWHDGWEEPEEMKELLVEWESDDATWHTVGFYDARTDMFRGEYKMPIDNVVRWMYVDELLGKERMEEQQ